jgi:hypothetical protein
VARRESFVLSACDSLGPISRSSTSKGS